MSTETFKWTAPADVLAEANDTDIFFYSSTVSRENAVLFTKCVKSTKPRRTKAVLVLTTNGGDPDAAYIIAKCLKRNYPAGFSTYIFGPCKSSGTLIASASSEIVMSDLGELGPLDIQIGKTDELFVRGSGLDINEAISYIKSLVKDTFVQNLVELKSGTSITTKTAADIAQSLATGLATPLINQIDPIKIGETQRAMQITRDYGKLLAPDCKGLEKLITEFASHSFVIDREEAMKIFEKRVREPNENELALGDSLEHLTINQSNFIFMLSSIKVVPTETISPNQTEPNPPLQ